MMKVFVPITDEMLQDRASIEGSLVPFNPAYLRAREPSRSEGMKPPNWLSDNDYAAARKRLADTQA